ncbi:hypothetical protein ACU8KH_01655 [Lachancea thermotolerans]
MSMCHIISYQCVIMQLGTITHQRTDHNLTITKMAGWQNLENEDKERFLNLSDQEKSLRFIRFNG